MKIYIFFIMLLLSSCASKITNTKEYKIAKDEIRKERFISDISLIKRKELKKHGTLIVDNDTLDLLQKNVVGLKSVGTKKNYIFHFNETDTYKLIVCDEYWKVELVQLINRK